MKKLNRLTLIYLGALGLLLTNACTDKYDLYNTNPAIITADLVNVNLLLTYVETGIASSAGYGNSGDYGSYCGMCKRDDDNSFTEQDTPGEWDFEYTSQLNNLSNIIHLIDGMENKAELVNKTAIARILKAWSVSKLTDTYGDVPYSESCLPQDKAILQPKYDTQESIYADLFKELKEAAAQLDASKVSYGSADLVYQGDVTKWRKLANSLRLRLALRIRYVNPTMAATQLSDLTEAGLITTLADDAKVFNSTDFIQHTNPRYYRIINYGTTQESVHTHQTLINILKNDSVNMDPRIRIYADTVMAAWKGGLSPNGYFFPNYKYRGAPTLAIVSDTYKYPWGSGTVSDISDLWRVPVLAPAVMKASEVYFSLAEAKLAGILPASFSGTANSYYQKGIDAAIDWAKWFYDLTAPQMSALMIDYIHNPEYSAGAQWTQADVDQYLEYKKIKDAEIAAFKATPVYTLSGSADQQLEMIINQKLVALYPDEFQGWCEYRRTGYPKVAIANDNSTALKGKVPRRQPWPTREEQINSSSYEAALARYGTDSKLTKMWWDANPVGPHMPNYVFPTMPTPYQ